MYIISIYIDHLSPWLGIIGVSYSHDKQYQLIIINTAASAFVTQSSHLWGSLEEISKYWVIFHVFWYKIKLSTKAYARWQKLDPILNLCPLFALCWSNIVGLFPYREVLLLLFLPTSLQPLSRVCLSWKRDCYSVALPDVFLFFLTGNILQVGPIQDITEFIVSFLFY